MKPPNSRKGDGEFQVDQILGQVLRNAVWERLDTLASLANQADTPALVSVARSELPRLTEGWRAMLRGHEPDERGDCPTCSTRWHKVKTPCQVWQVAHEHLVAGGLATQRATHRRMGRRSAPTTASPHQGSALDTKQPKREQSRGKHALIPSASPRRAVVDGFRR